MSGGGERIKVYIVLKPGTTATAEEITLFCRQNLAPFKTPKIIEFREQLPKTMVGKILRRELRSQEVVNEKEEEERLIVR